MVGHMIEEPLPPLDVIPPDLQSLADYERRAPQHMPAASWAHIESGAGAEHSLRQNREQFERYHLLPRALVDMKSASTAIDLFGQQHAAPIFLAPIAYQRLAHPAGEIATVRAATALGTTMIVSTLSSFTLEEIANAAQETAAALNISQSAPLWFQLYFQADREHSLLLVQRAEAAGYQALVVTVDASVKRSSFDLPIGVEAANLRNIPRLHQNAAPSAGHILFGSDLLNASPTWEDIAWLRSTTTLPIIIKGLLHADDVSQAQKIGANAVILSNHGGRVIDGLISPMDALEHCKAKLDDNFPLLIDSGFRSGTDIAKAIALGASAVLIGRPQIHALAVAGMAGVAHLLHILRAELELTMAHLGCPTISALTAAHLYRSR
jgi:4-hydroxymandelate oxidase